MPNDGTSATSSCPICNAVVPSATLERHANHCLDALSQGHDPNDIPSPPLSPPSSSPPTPALTFTTLKSDRPPKPAQCKPAQRPSDSLADWLAPLGLSKYTSALLRADYRTVSDLCNRPPSDNSLREHCGVTALGARRKILSALSSLQPVTSFSTTNSAMSETKPTAGSSSSFLKNQVTHGADDNAKENPDVKPKRKLWAIFEPGYRAASSPPKRPRGQGLGENKARADPGGVESKGGRKHIFSHRVAGTSFTVDSFKAAISDPGCMVFFLTHFHSDHYGGLAKKRFPAGARVVCTVITSRLVQSQLHIPESFIRVLPVGRKVDFVDAGRGDNAGASVWAYEANHCPGAVVLLFYVWATKRYILHCGDCRFDEDVFNQHRKLVEVIRAGQLDVVHLDTTYCNARYSFPKQRTVLDDVVRIARSEDARTRKRCLFFFGTYSIGKEKVFLAVARALDLHIYASKRKRGILEACDLGDDYTKRIVEDPQQARVHVVSMFDLKPGMLTKYASRNGLNTNFVGRGLAVLFRPTGWTFDGSSEAPKGTCRPSDQAIVFSVPYSEHSSFDELKRLVKWANPARIIPTVGGHSKEKSDAMRAQLEHVDRPMRAIRMGNPASR